MQAKSPTLNEPPNIPTSNNTNQNNDLIPAVGKKYPRYLVTISFGFAALFAELMLFLSLYYNSEMGLGLRLILTGGTLIFSFGVMLASFILPHRFYLPRFSRYSPIVFLMVEWAASVLTIVAGSIVLLVVGIFVVKGDLAAIGEIVRSMALYTLAACLLMHGLAVFGRYVQYLYEREMHQSYKIVIVAGVSAVALIAIALYLLPNDFNRIGANIPNSGLLDLHISIRDVWLLATCLYAFFWQITVLADH